MSLLIPMLYLGALAAVAVAAKRTRHRDPRPDRLRSRLARLLLGVVAYPAVMALVWYALRGSYLATGLIVLLALPGLLFGALVDRLWIAAVPPAGAGILLLIGYVGDPSCANSCGEDSWTEIALMTTLYMVLPAIFTLLLGIVARNVLGRRAASRIRSRTAPGFARR